MSAAQDMLIVLYGHTWYPNVYKNTCSDVRMCGYVRGEVIGVHTHIARGVWGYAPTGKI